MDWRLDMSRHVAGLAVQRGHQAGWTIEQLQAMIAATGRIAGVQARMMSQNLKTIVPSLGLSKTALVFINQTRMKIGVMYGNPETTPGGKALKFYTSVRMRIAKKGMLGSRGKEHGIRSRVQVKKNKIAPPWKEAEFDIEWGQGISQEGDILDAIVEAGIVSQAGGYFRYNDEMIGHGRENAKAFLAQHPELFAELRAQVLGEQIEGAAEECPEAITNDQPSTK